MLLFDDTSLAHQVVLNKISQLISKWSKAQNLLEGLSLTDMKRNKAALLH